MTRKWKYFNTNYRQAWNEYRKTEDYRRSSAAMLHAGIKQPYRDNILKSAFSAAWRASGVKTTHL